MRARMPLIVALHIAPHPDAPRPGIRTRAAEAAAGRAGSVTFPDRARCRRRRVPRRPRVPPRGPRVPAGARRAQAAGRVDEPARQGDVGRARGRARAGVPRLAGDARRQRLGRHHLAGRVRRARRHRRPGAHLRPGGVALPRVERRVHGRDRDGRAHDHQPRHRGAEGLLPPPDAERRARLVPALLRARRRLRPRGPHDACRARRRRARRQRPEGVDVGRALLRLGDDARPHELGRPEAPGHLVDRGRHALARHRGAAAAPDHRVRALQRGVPHRRAGAGRRTSSAGSTTGGASRSPRSATSAR